MKLSEKLRAFIKEPKEAQAFGMEKPDVVDICDVLKGIRVNNVFGEHLIIEKTYNENYSHAGVKLSEVLEIPSETLTLLSKDCNIRGFDFKKAIFIDTETTGLAGGSGTYAFLVGIGFFDGIFFRLRQYFMRDFDEENAMLYSLQKFLRDFNCIVSFNGKSYDIPLLATRFLLNRMENPLQDFMHLDLLSSARRLYSQRFESISLSSLEKKLFCINRQGDVPGYEIPSLYFRFLRDKNPYPLKPVIYHNGMDILSMVALAVKMADALENPFCSENCADQDYLCVAKLYQDMGFFNEAIDCYRKALEVPEVEKKAYLQLSMLLKKLNRWREAVELWQYMVNNHFYEDIALIELAKYYEHKLRDYVKAAEITEKAISLVYRKKAIGYSQNLLQSDLIKLKKRQARLNLKINNQFRQIL